MKKLSTNGQVISSYIDQAYPKASNYIGSLSFDGTTLYSYDSLLAVMKPADKVLFLDSDTRVYSNTTIKQVYLLLRHFGDFTVYSFPIGLRTEQILEYYWGEVEAAITKFKRAYRHKATHKHSIEQLMNEAESYAAYMKIDKRARAYQFKYQIIRELFKHQIL